MVNFETGSISGEQSLPHVKIKKVLFLESRHALLALGDKCLYVISAAKKDQPYLRIDTTIENITTDSLIEDMMIKPLTKKFIKEIFPTTPVEDYDDEVLIIFTLGNANILTALLRFIPKPN